MGELLTDAGAALATQPRPMLARVADAMYWMSRYVERSEHVGRIVLETASLLTDVGDMEPQLRLEQWRGLLRILTLEQAAAEAGITDGPEGEFGQRVARYLTFDPSAPNSLLSCIVTARENARSVRENISGEMWENLNTLYWFLYSGDGKTRYEESPGDVWRQVTTGSLLFQGMTDQTLAHGQGWLFAQVGRYLERLDMACRLLSVKYALLRQAEPQMESAERNIHWMALLKSCASLEAYRRIHVGDMDPDSVLSFVILEPTFPQSIRYCVRHAHEAVARIRMAIDRHSIDAAERILGRLHTQLEYADVNEILRTGALAYLAQVQESTTAAAEAIRKLYFLH